MAGGVAERGASDRWIPWAFVAFFAVVLVVNGIMIWFAFASWTGLEAPSAYRRGIEYNRTLEAARAQAALGWRVELGVSREGPRLAEIELRLEDRHGDLIEDAAVSALLVRPTSAGHDLAVDLPHDHAGRYRAEVALPLDGQWDVRVTAQARGEVYRLSERVHLRP